MPHPEVNVDASPPSAFRDVTCEFTEADYLRGMEVLVRAVQELSMARTVSAIQRIVRSSARTLVGCDGATVVLRDGDMCYYADEDAIAPLWKGSRFPMSTCISGWAMLNRASAVIPDIYVDSRIPHEAYRPTFVKSLVMVPIRKLAPVGAIGAYWSTERQPSEREVALLQALADSTSIAMENVQIYAELDQRVHDRTAELEQANAKIHQLSLTDELTGLSNRRGFYLLAESALRAAQHDRRRCLLAFLDIDGLKHVNDQHGHDVGDQLIADVAAVLRDTLPEPHILARVGGDEFCALLHRDDTEPARLEHSIRAALRSFNEAAQRPYSLSASVGLAETKAGDTYTLDEVLIRADEMMYRDKRARSVARNATSKTRLP
ncbi:sensor domain-containing diguanylate cyclase [Mycobacterium sp. CBMA293]|nr:sensor domain-containing diguanylate cyclase [Mycolicibacterium sp. CBMA 360]MUL57974.1 sensor domain-containing diguanylate cyclase [Mycolicibacterium sp. CBMA 335]MUL73432.1 sensor domain-containing diguanylate cyclase [Mycolicibacterium sp. CBMA 311]MUL95510.1 sensor domain-containing diguanylate cyclase [Mycolicibacterium sp. CBMA 230]MUM07405.1 diguanylate cyclase [Mycolicibacterium sp. CBMA 213]MUM09700.1 sensor domain-containing diguanylate cyclase [Mycolicibacterium sp. CBMA 293]MU